MNVLSCEFQKLFKLRISKNEKLLSKEIQKTTPQQWSILLDVNFKELSEAQKSMFAFVFFDPSGWENSEKFLMMRFGIIGTQELLNMLATFLIEEFHKINPIFHLIKLSDPVDIIYEEVNHDKYSLEDTLERYSEFKGYKVKFSLLDHYKLLNSSIQKLPRFFREEIILESSPIIIRKNAYMKPYMQCMVLDSFAKSGICYVPNPQYEN